MPLVAPAIKAKFKQRIYDGLKKNFNPATSKGEAYSGVADEFWLKLADAVSDIAMDLVEEITTNAQVMPGIAVTTAGSPTNHSGATTSPGKIK